MATYTDFAPHNMTGNSSPSPYIASASAEYSELFAAYKAFENNVGSNQYWISNTSTGWLRIYIGTTARLLNNYSVRVNAIPEPNRAPKDWTLQGSVDGTNWTTLDTVTGQTSWSSGQTRNFVCDDLTASYNYFRIVVTANNGDGLLQIGELYLYEEDIRIPLNYLQDKGRNRLNLLPISLGRDQL